MRKINELKHFKMSKKENMKNFENFDVWYIIIEFLPLHQVLKLRNKLICKEIYNITSDEKIWKPVKEKIEKLPQKLIKWKGFELISHYLNGDFDHIIADYASEIGGCYYGAASCKVYPFFQKLPQSHNNVALTAKMVLESLHINNFKSDFIKNLDTDFIPYPGYHPYQTNDEIHTEWENNYVFNRDNIEKEYLALKNYVRNQNLFFVLIHHKYGEDFLREYNVDLWVVGHSPFNNLIGVKTSQVCHNLCD